MYRLIRPVLFRLDPEQAHHITLRLLALPIVPLLAALFDVPDARLRVTAFGLTFRNPIGLAAGYDKNGRALDGLAALGFGHLEAGTLTRRAQPGNPRPRIFRWPADDALINRMGFPNDGVDSFAPRLNRARVRLGINIGKSKDTPLDRAADDYCALLRQVAPQADYVAVNVSSPNTPGLRRLQSKQAVGDLLREVAATRAELPRRVPVLIKVAPDLSWPELDDVLEAIAQTGLDGIIAANTTVGREGLRSPESLCAESGGLSGRPLRARSTEMIRYIYRHTEGRLPIVGVGGVNGPAAALEKLEAGATLVQVYTGLVYEGPGVVRQILRGLLG
ncbi:MAG: quinone-dependent dihydroorotate dehydrogenase [Chloroflexi bacterium]|nr:quinone-dependent dihydroorotate dehydrogenase [Chloroflexota bacterium]